MKICNKNTTKVHTKIIPVIGIGSDGNNAIKKLEKEHLMNFSPQTILPKIKKDKNDILPAFIITGPEDTITRLSLLETINHCKDIGYTTTVIIRDDSYRMPKLSYQLNDWIKCVSKCCHSFIVFPTCNLSISSFFSRLDNIFNPLLSIIQMDMGDLAYFLKDTGEWTIGWNFAMGENAAKNAIPHAVQSATTNSLQHPGKMLVHFQVSENTPLYNIDEAIDYVFKLPNFDEMTLHFTVTIEEGFYNQTNVSVMAGDFQEKQKIIS